MELDHLFIRARPGAPEASLLQAIGLQEGSGNCHPGQGTENRRFFFRNAFIELLWMSDEAQITSEETRRTRLHERLGGPPGEASPFGVCLRPSGAGDGCAFPAWRYKPAYLPPGMTIGIAQDAPLAEPMWFFLAAATRPDAAPAGSRQPLRHAAGFGEITSVRITVPGLRTPSQAALAAIGSGIVSLAEGAGHLMEIGFDGQATGHAHDLRPGLPLVLRY